jgi:hypothetical protein
MLRPSPLTCLPLFDVSGFGYLFLCEDRALAGALSILFLYNSGPDNEACRVGNFRSCAVCIWRFSSVLTVLDFGFLGGWFVIAGRHVLVLSLDQQGCHALWLPFGSIQTTNLTCQHTGFSDHRIFSTGSISLGRKHGYRSAEIPFRIHFVYWR